MRRIQSTDIVPVSVLQNIAIRTRKAIAAEAKSKRAPLIGRDSGAKNKYDPRHIKILTPRVTEGQVSIDLGFSKIALAFEHGGDPHPIDARNKPLLIFEGTNGFKGLIRTPHVNHPGFAARPYMRAAKTRVRKANLEDLQKTTLANLRLIVSEMRREV